MKSAGLTHDECSLAEQMFCSDDVRSPFESAPDDADFDALRQVLISDSTYEIVDIPEKPCQVKFTWRYASNRIAQKNPVKDELFTEQYNYSFKSFIIDIYMWIISKLIIYFYINSKGLNRVNRKWLWVP